jgi:hypothetical protein
MKLIQYGLSADAEEHAYYYLGDDENLRLATVEQKFPVNYFPDLSAAEKDALDLFNRHGIDYLYNHRPKVHVSEFSFWLFLFFTGKKISNLINGLWLFYL